MPKLDCPTRWCSLYDMLDALLKLRDFCDHHSGSYAELKLTEEDCQWINCKLKTKKIGTPFAVALLDAMTEREKKLLSNDAFVFAILLDPRYNFLLTAGEVKRGKNYLKQLSISQQKSKVLDNNEDQTPKQTTKNAY
ncbi:hypothetical protein DAPPUDRAFT_330892 [Daphnia pulex]|uniref:Uncharacterized protein n=1 Tax=Daphnia pulex TaxID=6669 RepID=E9HKY2_DAPPU|nr:hypothetical protein DAPPUDRAFT_330892 [Daphnia pulex]|eukprot:EFX67601.1 hypothetical protein DAPPUDRAFT_330892 [Daphnia pulex]